MSAPQTEHASCVALDGAGLLILGKSKAGKSAFALQLMAYGAKLIADDRVILDAEAGHLIATCPVPLQGLIEARGIGLLRAEASQSVRVVAAVEMDLIEASRFPLRRMVTFCGCEIDLFHRVDGIHFAPAMLQYLRCGRSDR